MSERIPMNEAGVQRTVFAIRTLLIGLEFADSDNADLLIGLATALNLPVIGMGDVDSDDFRHKIEAL
jgi:hypothetical protein